jgi:hypothetical protein
MSSRAANPPPNFSITEHVIPTAGAQPKNDNGDYEPPPIHYVSLSGAHVAPFTSWYTAATNIQAAIDAAAAGDTVLVTNGVYNTGGRVLPGANLTNRIVVTNAIIVQSVNGLSNTLIVGQGPRGDSAVRCAYLANGVVLSGFTLSNGCTRRSGDKYKDRSGGGVYADGAVVSNCVITGNSANEGGGTYGGTVNNCTITGNSAGWRGGGTGYSTVNNCLITGNGANEGGGTYGGTVNNCTLTGNSAGLGGGTYNSTVNNCIVCSNSGSNFSGGTYAYSCTTPLPSGAGNIATEPGFVNTNGDYHLALGSPCIDAGNNAYAAGFDLDGRSRIIGAAVDMGCCEASQVHVGESPVHFVSLSGGNIWPYTNWATAATILQHAVDAANASDTVLVTNGVYDAGGRPANGALTNRVAIDRPLIVRSVNGPEVTIIEGAGPNGDSAIRCVYLGTNAALIGFTLTNGHTTSREGNDIYGGGIFCEPSAVLSNCVLTGNSAYDFGGGGGASGGTLYNCTLTGNVAYWGGGAYSGALYRCILTRNMSHHDGGGGGASDATLHNCTLTGNSSEYAGGANHCTLYDCMLTSNSAGYGGGAYYSTLYNCTLTGNSAYLGGGTLGRTANNCVIYYNTATDGPNYSGGIFNYCCTKPDPGGMGNITNEPMFVSTNAGNYRLQAGSPCIDAGTNQQWMIGATDLDGLARIRGGRVDMGAYEYEYIPSAWLAQYGLPSDGSADLTDNDGDSMDNWREWRCNTDPTNETSFLHFTTSAPEGAGFVLHWQSAESVRYRLKRSTNLCTDGFSYLVRTNIVATPSINTETDKTAGGSGPWFYRVGVE